MLCRCSLVLAALLLAGCGGSGSAQPRSTPTSVAVAPTTIARTATIPRTTPPPVKGTNRHKGVKQAPLGGALPTAPPVTYPTPTAIPGTAYTAILKGTVSDAKDNSPLAGAVVVVGTGQRRVRTDSFGGYIVRFPAGPPVSVRVTMQGYQGQLAIGSIDPHKTMHLDFKLSKVASGQAPPAPTLFGTPSLPSPKA